MNEENFNDIITGQRFLCHLGQKRMIDGIEGTSEFIPSTLINKVGRPTAYKCHVSNKWQWLPVSIRICDTIKSNITKVLRNYIDSPCKLEVIIESFDYKGKSFEKWNLINAEISEINFGTLDWSVSDSIQIKVEIRYENAKLVI